LWLEQFFIDAYDPWFNIAKLAGSNHGVKKSEEERHKMSLFRMGKVPWNKGIPRTESIKLMVSIINSRPVIQYDLSMKFIRGWPSTISIFRGLGIKTSNISSVLTGRSKTAGGFIWERKDKIK
jgi:hypothetical protein